MRFDLFPGFSSAHVDLADVRIHYARAGQGEPLLLLHGYPQSLACWHRMAPVARCGLSAPRAPAPPSPPRRA